MRRHLAGTAALTLLLAGHAQSADQIVLTYENASHVAVSGSDVFPLDDKGEPIEDNLGGFFDGLAVGATKTVELSAFKCGPMLIRITLENGKELRINLDTCADTHVRIVD